MSTHEVSLLPMKSIVLWVLMKPLIRRANRAWVKFVYVQLRSTQEGSRPVMKCLFGMAQPMPVSTHDGSSRARKISSMPGPGYSCVFVSIQPKGKSKANWKLCEYSWVPWCSWVLSPKKKTRTIEVAWVLMSTVPDDWEECRKLYRVDQWVDASTHQSSPLPSGEGPAAGFFFALAASSLALLVAVSTHE